jgi:hypothetical protein
MDVGWKAHLVAIEEAGDQRAYVSLDDRKWLALDNSVDLGKVLGQLRTLFESWKIEPGASSSRKP